MCQGANGFLVSNHKDDKDSLMSMRHSSRSYLCRIGESIQNECTKIRTSNVVQDSIKRTYDTIILWLHMSINSTYNEIVTK